MKPQAFSRVREERKETVEISENWCQESKPLSEGTGILEGRGEIHLGSVLASPAEISAVAPD